MNSTIIIESVANSLNDYLGDKHYSKIAVLVDENTKRHCLPLIEGIVDSPNIIEIKSGEENKNLDSCQHIWQSLTDLTFDRRGLLINLGGGVIGDMGGFCAATYKRGIDFINIPTTLLAMVDASVGGKLGIDFGVFKNHIGLFKEPKVVLIDPVFLNTLPERELKSGYAEVMKHALITGKGNWLLLKDQPIDSIDWKSTIESSVAIKSSIVKQDLKESGLRKILNFGHTIGHAVESHFLKSDHRLLHGEAVGIGMIVELYLSVMKHDFPEDSLKEIEATILDTYGHFAIPNSTFNTIAQVAKQDKKNTAHEIKAVLLENFGKPIIDTVITTDEIVEGLLYYSKLNV